MNWVGNIFSPMEKNQVIIGIPARNLGSDMAQDVQSNPVFYI